MKYLCYLPISFDGSAVNYIWRGPSVPNIYLFCSHLHTFHLPLFYCCYYYYFFFKSQALCSPSLPYSCPPTPGCLWHLPCAISWMDKLSEQMSCSDFDSERWAGQGRRRRVERRGGTLLGCSGLSRLLSARQICHGAWLWSRVVVSSTAGFRRWGVGTVSDKGLASTQQRAPPHCQHSLTFVWLPLSPLSSLVLCVGWRRNAEREWMSGLP